LHDGDKGPNTEGIGAVTPVQWLTAEQMGFMERRVLKASLDAFTRNGIYFQGVLTSSVVVALDGVKALEYNAHFGDPACQAYLRLLRGDLLPILEACVDGSIADMKIDWHYGHVAAVVLCAQGFPDSWKTGAVIQGISEAQSVPEVVVFHNGTVNDGEMRVAGGRVLTVTGLGATLTEALQRVYTAIQKIEFEGMYYRHDIGGETIKIAKK
jgi:phosphoribosylamine--glycine ligase